jgi:Abortive infection C-terminus
MPQRRHDLVPLAVRYAVRDSVGGWGLYSVAEIAERFEVEGFRPAVEFEPTGSGARRAEADRFHAAIDFTSAEQVGRYLRIVERILDDYDNDDGRSRHAALTKTLSRAGILPDSKGRLRLPAPPLAASARLAALPSESGIRLHVERLERLDQEPEELIGAAKELVEATAKFVLMELGETIGDHEDLAAVSKKALVRLRLHPETIAPTAKGADVMTRLLGGLAQVASGLAELRNMGYGTGHGRGGRVTGIKPRHAEFAARSAVAYATFVLDTLEDEDAPWRTVAAGPTADAAN